MDKPSPVHEVVATITAICNEFEAYGYRRVDAELRHQGIAVNYKKIRRLMREHDLQPKRRRRFVATTDSDHDSPIFPDLARDRIVFTVSSRTQHRTAITGSLFATQRAAA
jgi:putative transposase